MCLLLDLFPYPHDEINERCQAYQDTDGGVDSVEYGGGSCPGGSDDGWLYILSGFDESAHDYV